MTNEELYTENLARLDKIDDSIKEQIKSVLIGMYKEGLRPLIDKDVWRDPAKQLEMFNRGVSKLKWGFHCATKPDGSPGSLAADIVDAEHGWYADKEYAVSNTDEKFWVSLGRHALNNGLTWGGFFGITNETQLRQELAENKFYNGQQFGWDPAHVNVNGLSLKDAQEGVRL